MTETNHGNTDLELWQRALKDQHEAEEKLEAARVAGNPEMFQLTSRVIELRTRADLLLADVAKAQARARNPLGATSSDIDLDAPSESFSAD